MVYIKGHCCRPFVVRQLKKLETFPCYQETASRLFDPRQTRRTPLSQKLTADRQYGVGVANNKAQRPVFTAGQIPGEWEHQIQNSMAEVQATMLLLFRLESRNGATKHSTYLSPGARAKARARPRPKTETTFDTTRGTRIIDSLTWRPSQQSPQVSSLSRAAKSSRRRITAEKVHRVAQPKRPGR